MSRWLEIPDRPFAINKKSVQCEAQVLAPGGKRMRCTYQARRRFYVVLDPQRRVITFLNLCLPHAEGAGEE